MAVLNAWQRIDRVIPGKNFGNGSDGAYSSATIPNPPEDSCSGTATSTTLTTTGSTFANGDILLIHQTRGTGAGQWEINKVVSGGGSTSLTLAEANHYTYTDSGASQAQAVKILQYTDCTVQSGTWTVPAWDGNKGGIFPLAVRGTLTITGNIAMNGVVGNNTVGTSSAAGAVGIGFSGGMAAGNTSATSWTGEGSANASLHQQSANGTGGGAGYSDDGTGNPAGGGGGGNGTAGTAGGATAPSSGGAAGGTGGAADLTTMLLGGGGGGANNHDLGCSSGSGGGGIALLFANIVSIAGTIHSNGGDRKDYGATNKNGGAGAGGSVLLACRTATLGTALVTATGGVGSSGNGTGGSGRIAVHHSGTVTGTTSPTFEDVTDTSMKENIPSMFLVF